MSDNIYYKDLPLALGLALSQNTIAMKKFIDLGAEKQKEIIEKTKYIESKQQMREFVSRIGEDENPDIFV